MKVKLTKPDAEETLHKLVTLAETPDLQNDYGISQTQADELRDSVPPQGGRWEIPSWASKAVRGEMSNHCEVLAGIAADARSGGKMGESLRISKQAKRLREIFA